MKTEEPEVSEPYALRDRSPKNKCVRGTMGLRYARQHRVQEMREKMRRITRLLCFSLIASFSGLFCANLLHGEPQKAMQEYRLNKDPLLKDFHPDLCTLNWELAEEHHSDHSIQLLLAGSMVQTVEKYYKSSLMKKGWKLKSEKWADKPDDEAHFIFTKDNYTVKIDLTPVGEKEITATWLLIAQQKS